jgi:hypothetical protein
VDKMPDLIETRVIESQDANTKTETTTTEEIIVDVDLTKHMFRLCTQRLLYEARTYENKENIEEYDNDLPLSHQSIPFLKRSFNSQYTDDDDHLLAPPQPKLERNKTQIYELNLDELPEIPPPKEASPRSSKLSLLKSQIRDHLKYMSDYLNQQTNSKDTDKYEPDKQFIKTLCDDMDIALKTIGTRNQQSYINARSSSQGRQQMNNVNMNDDLTELSGQKDNDINNAYATPTALKLMRGFSQR